MNEKKQGIRINDQEYHPYVNRRTDAIVLARQEQDGTWYIIHSIVGATRSWMTMTTEAFSSMYKGLSDE